ncbi:MAG: cobalt transporter CbiM [Acidobacteriia bacterium]|nr:cobalt transporter CbiM [Terriglobia bacterium]
MHIPDGYLGPQTYLPAWAVMAPLWSWASARLKRTLSVRRLPMMALAAAFAFVVMMFNVPLPGGTSGHAVGSVLVAVLLGPWAAVVAVSLALAVQALLFGDGGITALAANCFTMAVVMPFAGWWTYRLLAGASSAASRRRYAAAAAGGYVGVNVAALATGALLGIQPLIARDPSGRPLYCPFGLSVAVPAMAVSHLLVVGFVEAAVTALALAYLTRTEPGLTLAAAAQEPTSRALKRFALAVAVLALLSPLGLVLAARFGGGTAWGEWSADRLSKLVGYLPSGFQRLSSLWRAPLPGYGPLAAQGASTTVQAVWYAISAVVGVGAVAAVVLVLRRLFTRRERDDRAA